MPAIDRKFENQKEYIACAKGCSLCCETVSMPFSDIEFEYLKDGFYKLDEEKKKIVIANIEKLLSNSGKPCCPFLINKACSVYKNRGLICRTFGLLIVSDEEEYTVPFCVHKGLNYSKIFDETTQKIDPQRVTELGCENEPKFYPLTRQTFFNLQLAKDLDIIPKDSKPLSEWLKEFYEEEQQKIKV